ncbi:L,D-transpeptidase family protein [Streptomyces sp. DH24]|uniref:L,D-transpeptidase family protein n=1 Tax=Streptomyces sp. DH24 TaxID=3040123 RepID=UPI002441B819|nr:L,D-transpeptidase family protein [Streptomyces sp. DH24]MDG9716920.1 L,D-transpeptidase family protein [Streptomyces sp. DH24]
MISRRVVRRSVAVLLAAVAVLPVGAASGVPGAPVPPGTGPEGRLVSGPEPGPFRPGAVDTPDQALPPEVYTPSAAEDAVEPPDAAEGTDDLVEHMPPGGADTRAAGCTRRTGPYQRQAERWLRLRADGRQSPADCRAIRAFQQWQGIRPAVGYAGPVTWARMRLVSAQLRPNAGRRCPVRAYRVACVDLGRQLTWVQKGRKVLYGPVPIRSGRAGYRTRAGWHRVYWRHKNHWSTLYRTPMPYAQFFSGGQAFHGIYGSVHARPGSMGCVNLRVRDARALWSVLRKGDRVYVWGRKPGT